MKAVHFLSKIHRSHWFDNIRWFQLYDLYICQLTITHVIVSPLSQGSSSSKGSLRWECRPSTLASRSLCFLSAVRKRAVIDSARLGHQCYGQQQHTPAPCPLSTRGLDSILHHLFTDRQSCWSALLYQLKYQEWVPSIWSLDTGLCGQISWRTDAGVLGPHRKYSNLRHPGRINH